MLTSEGPFDNVRERAFDVLLGVTAPKAGALSPLVVDIDRRSLAALGPWPWGRDRLAEVIAVLPHRVNKARPLRFAGEGG